MANLAGVLQSRFFPAKLEAEGNDAIFNTLLEVERRSLNRTYTAFATTTALGGVMTSPNASPMAGAITTSFAETASGRRMAAHGCVVQLKVGFGENSRPAAPTARSGQSPDGLDSGHLGGTACFTPGCHMDRITPPCRRCCLLLSCYFLCVVPVSKQ